MVREDGLDVHVHRLRIAPVVVGQTRKIGPQYVAAVTREEDCEAQAHHALGDGPRAEEDAGLVGPARVLQAIEGELRNEAARELRLHGVVEAVGVFVVATLEPLGDPRGRGHALQRTSRQDRRLARTGGCRRDREGRETGENPWHDMTAPTARCHVSVV
jgi:hypothetical protein